MQIQLSQFKFFQHKKSCTLWLDPTQGGDLECGPLNELQNTLIEPFPDCTDLCHDPSRGITKFIPHLSVGQWPSLQSLSVAQSQLQADWALQEFEVNHVCLISRKNYHDPFQIRYRVYFEGFADEVNEPYCAG